MRKRFRGNQPIAVSKELEGGGGGGMLYAGKPAFESTVKTVCVLWKGPECDWG